MNTEILRFYADHGWQMFPVKYADKTPLVKWADEATTEWNKITGWLDHFGQMNIGIATGERSGIFVLDVDAGHNGFESLETLRKVYGDLPKTPTVITGGGGRHYVFKHPHAQIRNVQNSGKLGAGLDIRGDGGYIVAAPSLHKSGHYYAWDKNATPSTTPLADAPDWMVKLLTAETQQQAHTEPRRDNAAVIAGGRNNYLTGLAGAMRRKGMTMDAIYNALMIENRAKCQPQLLDAEVRRIAESVTRYTPTDTFEENKDRLQVEWSFCKSIYEFPTNLPDFVGVRPQEFADKRLAAFWERVLLSDDMTQAAMSAGILSELETYKDYDVTRLDGYAAAIKQFSTLASYERYAKQLLQRAKDADPAGIEKTVTEIAKIPAMVKERDYSMIDAANEVREYAEQRAADPRDVWGIPYAWDRISKHTGGKQEGEAILLAGEPKKGKSWWCLQDALETAMQDIPVFYWSGEMRKRQLQTRLEALLGVPVDKMRKGTMTDEDWQKHREAQAIILNIPFFADDTVGLNLYELRPMLSKMKAQHGIRHFVIDYISKIKAPGRDEIEQSANVTNELSDICVSLNLSSIMIASVIKQGMDNKTTVMKSNIRGSGQQLHDAHVIFQLTSFPEADGQLYGIQPRDYYRCIAMNISAGRELSQHIEGGYIPYMREANSPRFVEITKGNQ